MFIAQIRPGPQDRLGLTISIAILILRFSPIEHSWNSVDTILMFFLAINLSILVSILIIERSLKLIGFTLILKKNLY